MSIEQREIQPDLWVVRSGLEEAAGLPMPVDKLIGKGYPIRGPIQKLDLELAQVSLEDSFAHAREDQAKQFGRCVLWATELIPEHERDIEETLVRTANQQNHGMRAVVIDQKGVLWQGVEGGRTFKLNKHIGPLGLNNGDLLPKASVYGLLRG